MTSSNQQAQYEPLGKLFYAMMAAADSYSGTVHAAQYCAAGEDEPVAEKYQEYYC